MFGTMVDDLCYLFPFVVDPKSILGCSGTILYHPWILSKTGILPIKEVLQDKPKIVSGGIFSPSESFASDYYDVRTNLPSSINLSAMIRIHKSSG